jgi:hypothetical protein
MSFGPWQSAFRNMTLFLTSSSAAPVACGAVAIIASIPIVFSQYSFGSKCLALLPLYIPAMMLA